MYRIARLEAHTGLRTTHNTNEGVCGLVTANIYVFGKTRHSVNQKPLLRAATRADRAARVTEN
jgi:hypothetical protein